MLAINNNYYCKNELCAHSLAVSMSSVESDEVQDGQNLDAKDDYSKVGF